MQRYCGGRCRRLAHQERRKPKAASDDPEPLEVLLQAPMPVVEEAAAPPAAPVRVGPERDYAGSKIANAPPIFEDRDLMRARMHDRAGDDRFVAALAPALSPEARQRARPCASRRATRRRSCWGSSGAGPFGGAAGGSLAVMQEAVDLAVGLVAEGVWVRRCVHQTQPLGLPVERLAPGRCRTRPASAGG